MHKILIVDDNKNNRMILNLLLEDYLDENSDAAFEIEEAENGLVAVEKAQQTQYDIIFMDIMMPELNGIDATKKIRDQDKHAMIIAVSAIDDNERQREILSNGAEDYISKPVNADIFNSRLGNYLSIIASRNPQKFNADAINLYTQEIYSRRLIFIITGEDALSEFWEYYLLNNSLRCEILSDVVRVLYALGDVQLKLGIQSEIVVEESESHRYFTLNGLDKMDAKLVKLVLLKNSVVTDYLSNENRISFKLSESSFIEQLPQKEVAVQPEAVREVPRSTVKETPAPTLPEEKPAAANYTAPLASKEHYVFDYMEEEDLEEVELYLGKLSSLLLIVGNSDIETHEVEEIYTYLERIGRLLGTYNEAYRISQALKDLSETIAGAAEIFRSNSSALGPLAVAFSNDLMTWNRMVFHEGAPSIDFLDDTIIANAQMIGAMLGHHDDAAAADDLDDIFDF